MAKHKTKRRSKRRFDLPGCTAWVPKQGLCPAHLEEERDIRKLLSVIHAEDRPAGEDKRKQRQREYSRLVVTVVFDPRTPKGGRR